MDCRFNGQTRSLLRFVKRHDGEQERTIIDHFNDPRIPNIFTKLRKGGYLQRNKIISVPDGVEGQSASLIGIEWSITDMGRAYLRNSFMSDLTIVSIFCVIVFGIANIIIALSK